MLISVTLAREFLPGKRLGAQKRTRSAPVLRLNRTTGSGREEPKTVVDVRAKIRVSGPAHSALRRFRANQLPAVRRPAHAQLVRSAGAGDDPRLAGPEIVHAELGAPVDAFEDISSDECELLAVR